MTVVLSKFQPTNNKKIIIELIWTHIVIYSYIYTYSSMVWHYGSIKPRLLKKNSFTKNSHSDRRAKEENPFTTWTIGCLARRKRTSQYINNGLAYTPYSATLYHIHSLSTFYIIYTCTMRWNVYALMILYYILLVCGLSSHQNWIDCVCSREWRRLFAKNQQTNFPLLIPL